MSVIVLILEIAAIAILHTVKFNQEITSTTHKEKEMVESHSRPAVETATKSAILLTKLQ